MPTENPWNSHTAADERVHPPDISAVEADVRSIPGAIRTMYEFWLKAASVPAYRPLAQEVLANVFGVSAGASEFLGLLRLPSFVSDILIDVSSERYRFDDANNPGATPLSSRLDDLLIHITRGDARLGVVVLCRETDAPFVMPNGGSFQSAVVRPIEEFEQARAEYWNELKSDPEGDAPCMSFDAVMQLTDILRGRTGAVHCDGFVYASPTLLRQAGLSPGTTIHASDLIAAASLADLARVVSGVLERINNGAVDLLFLLTQVRTDWQARLVESRTHKEKSPSQQQPEVGPLNQLAGLAPPTSPSLNDLATIRAAAKLLGIDKVSIQRAIDDGIIEALTLADGRKVVSVNQCRQHWPDGPKPVGRPKKRS